jgi:hypothetical protein
MSVSLFECYQICIIKYALFINIKMQAAQTVICCWCFFLLLFSSIPVFLTPLLASCSCVCLLADYIHYGNDIGIERSLALDSPNLEVLERRKKGQAYLASKLSPEKQKVNQRGEKLSSKLVDCRFALAKVCMPLLRELEFPATRNFLHELRNRKQQSPTTQGYEKGMFEADSEAQSHLLYVGNDAVHTLGVEAFYAPIQNEINRRMSLLDGENNSILRFAPLSLNPELEKNAEMILSLTGMDKVRSFVFIF